MSEVYNCKLCDLKLDYAGYCKSCYNKLFFNIDKLQIGDTIFYKEISIKGNKINNVELKIISKENNGKNEAFILNVENVKTKEVLKGIRADYKTNGFDFIFHKHLYFKKSYGKYEYL